MTENIAEFLTDIKLDMFNSYQTGGVAKYLARPKTTDELIVAITKARQQNLEFEIIGAGSNLLISDDGYDGLIILLDQFNRYILRNGVMVTVGAGVKLIDLIGYAVENSLSGVERLAGIPGLVGGGVKMNAGAFDVEFKDFTESVELLNPQTLELYSLDSKDIGFSYRKSEQIDGKIVLSASIILKNDKKDKLIEIRSDILKRRKDKQPLDKPSCGSVFKRPENAYAGDLIELAGLKGLKHNGAMISDKHANFILNMGNAKSSDIKYLIDLIIDTVYKDFEITLKPEVRYIGLFR